MNNTVFLVDDDEAIVEALSIVLESADYHVIATSNGHSAFKKIQETMPDIILLDVLISGVDGRTICQKIKKDSKLSAIPVIMLSAHPTAKHTTKEYGAEDFLEKPFEISQLFQLLEKYLSKK